SELGKSCSVSGRCRCGTRRTSPRTSECSTNAHSALGNLRRTIQDPCADFVSRHQTKEKKNMAPRARFELATLRLTAGGYKTLSAAFGVAYEPYRCLSCP